MFTAIKCAGAVGHYSCSAQLFDHVTQICSVWSTSGQSRVTLRARSPLLCQPLTLSFTHLKQERHCQQALCPGDLG